MRITNQMLYNNTQYDYRRTMQGLYSANKQISSGTKIQQGYEDARIYDDTMRLDYNIVTLDQVKQSSTKAQTFTDNSDKALSQMKDVFTQINTKLIKASNSGTNSTTSLEAIANDLKGLKDELISIANTSINGQFLFSGSATNIAPIDTNGEYKGNDKQMLAVVGSDVKLAYNVSGDQLFMGMDSDYSKTVKTNVQLTNQLNTDSKEYITKDSTIEQLVGDYDGDTVFYLQGRKPNGDTFTSRFEVSPDSTMQDLMDKIGTEYGNDDTNSVVNVSMNKSGQMVVEDTQKGNNMLDFSIVAATDTTAGAGSSGGALQNNISDLDTNANVKITSFIQGGMIDIDGNETTGTDFDKTRFVKSGNTVTGSVSQVVQSTDKFATESTKLSEVAGASLDGESFTIEGKNKNGSNFNITLNLSNTGSTVNINGTDYDIPNSKGNPTSADDMTYRQLNDIVAMAVSNTEPAGNSTDEYNDAVVNSRRGFDVDLDYRGRVEVKDLSNPSSSVELSIYNTNSGTFSTSGTNGSVLSFAENNAITVDEPYVDIFKDIDNIIEAVKNELNESDSSSSFPRNMGIESSLQRLDHLSDHVSKSHTEVGSLSNALTASKDRAELLMVNVKTVQSEIIDVDIGESYLKLSQLSINYQAILQASSRINSLSLVNYM